MAKRSNTGPDPDIIDPVGLRHKPCSRCGKQDWAVEQAAVSDLWTPASAASVAHFRIICMNGACRYVLVTATLPVPPRAQPSGDLRQRHVPSRQLPNVRRRP